MDQCLCASTFLELSWRETSLSYCQQWMMRLPVSHPMQRLAIMVPHAWGKCYSFLLRSVAPDDYTPISSQPVTFSFDSFQKCVSITIIDDLMVEPNEQFSVMLESTDSAVQLIFSTATITILDSGE